MTGAVCAPRATESITSPRADTAYLCICFTPVLDTSNSGIGASGQNILSFRIFPRRHGHDQILRAEHGMPLVKACGLLIGLGQH